LSSAALLPVSSIDIGVAEFIVAARPASVHSARTSVWCPGIYAPWPSLPIRSTSFVTLISALALPIIVRSSGRISRPWGNGVSRLSIIARPLSNIVSHLSIIVVPACRPIRLIGGTSLRIALVIVAVVGTIVFHTLV
jgi:hypothetical protein